MTRCCIYFPFSCIYINVTLLKIFSRNFKTKKSKPKKNMKFVYFVLVVIYLKQLECCILDSGCRASEYCETGFFKISGRCIQGSDEGRACFRDRTCASKQCHFFQCKKRVNVENGPCTKSADCPPTQYCDKVDQRGELKQCMTRRCTGSCSRDEQCMSNNCRLWTCVSQDSSKCFK